MKPFHRLQNLKNLGKETAFLWGPRQTGKSTLLKSLFPQSVYYDLLSTKTLDRLNRRPWELREELLAGPLPKAPVIIDEVQKSPQLLDEIQWMIVNKNIQFILCGSSARKLKRGRGNLLGGRAIRFELFPLAFKEIPDFDLKRALNHGLLPRHYLSSDPRDALQSYISDYLMEEIRAEGLVRSLQPFGRFLESAAFSNGEIVNFSNIASDCGVSSPTVKEYFQILVDTLIGYLIPPYTHSTSRQMISATPKFYLFDVGVLNGCVDNFVPSVDRVGDLFEHLVLQLITSGAMAKDDSVRISTYRTEADAEVDFILQRGTDVFAIEVKSSRKCQSSDLRGLQSFTSFHGKKHIPMVIYRGDYPMEIDGVKILPLRNGLEFLGYGYKDN